MPTNKESIKFVWEFITSAQHNLIPKHISRQQASSANSWASLSIWLPLSGSLVLICSWVLVHVHFFFKLLNNLNKPMRSYHLPSLLHGLPVCLSQPSVHLILIQGFLLLWFCSSLSSGLQARFSLLLPLLSEF